MKLLFLYVSNLIILIFLFAAPVLSQSYAYKKYYSEEGFNGGQPTHLFQDHRGNIWVGTADGLVKFDGKNFTKYSSEDGLPANLITAINEDAEGHILVGTVNGYCEFLEGKIKQISIEKDSLPVHVTSICKLKDGKILVALGRKGLYYRSDSVLKPYISKIDEAIKRDTKNRDSVIITLHLNTDGTLLIGTFRNLYWFDGKMNKIEGFSTGFNVSSCNDGFFYAGIDNDGLYRLNKNKTVDSFKFSVESFLPLSGGEVLAASNSKLISVINKTLKEVKLVGDNVLPLGQVNEMMMDRENCIWLASQNGLVRLRKLSFAIDSLVAGPRFNNEYFKASLKFSNPFASDEEIKTIVKSCAKILSKDEDLETTFFKSLNQYYLLTDKNIYTINKNKVTRISFSNLKSTLNPYRFICEAKDETIWLLGTRGTAYLKNNELKVYTDTISDLQKYFDPRSAVWVAKADRLKRIWVSNSTHIGFWNGTHFEKVYIAKRGFRADEMKIDHNNNLWIHILGKGLYKISVFDDGTWNSKLIVPDQGPYYAIFFDKQNNIWFLKRDQLVIYKYIDRNSYDTIPRILTKEDGFNDLFAEYGDVYFTDNTKDSVFIYTSKKVFKIATGSVFLKETLPLISTYIEDIKLFMKNVQWKQEGFDLDNYGVPRNLTLAYNKNFITFYFNAISTIFPAKVTYTYMLKGYDKDWLPTSSINNATYSNIAPGSYSFLVKANNPDNITGPILEYKFTILPPWWKTWWFFLFSFLMLIGAILFVLRQRTLNLQTRNKLLEETVNERTAVLKKTNDDLLLSNQQNEMLISVMAHDVKSPLRFLADVSESLYNNWENIAEDKKRSYGLEIKKSTKTLSVFMNDFLLWIKLKKEKVAVNREDVNVLSLLNKVAMYHRESGNCGSNVLEVKAGSDICVKTNQKYLEIIISNLLDNACKYTKNGKVCLSAFANENEVLISCQDTGKGISKEKIERLLFGEDMDELERIDSFKLGYRFIQDMIKVIGAKLEIISELNKGTEVRVILSL